MNKMVVVFSFCCLSMLSVASLSQGFFPVGISTPGLYINNPYSKGFYVIAPSSVAKNWANIFDDDGVTYGVFRSRLVYGDFYISDTAYKLEQETGKPHEPALELGFVSSREMLDLNIDGYDLELTGLCIGGEVCGSDKSIYLPIPPNATGYVHRVVVGGHDGVGYQHQAELRLYEGDRLIGRQNVKRAGGSYTFYVKSNISEPLRLTSVHESGDASRGDETIVKGISVFTKALPPRGSRCVYYNTPVGCTNY